MNNLFYIRDSSISNTFCLKKSKSIVLIIQTCWNSDSIASGKESPNIKPYNNMVIYHKHKAINETITK